MLKELPFITFGKNRRCCWNPPLIMTRLAMRGLAKVSFSSNRSRMQGSILPYRGCYLLHEKKRLTRWLRLSVTAQDKLRAFSISYLIGYKKKHSKTHNNGAIANGCCSLPTAMTKQHWLSQF